MGYYVDEVWVMSIPEFIKLCRGLREGTVVPELAMLFAGDDGLEPKALYNALDTEIRWAADPQTKPLVETLLDRMEEAFPNLRPQDDEEDEAGG